MHKPDWLVPIVHVTGTFCNLRCMYCYHQGAKQSLPQLMSERVLERLIQKFLAFGDPAKPAYFSWHGGEPLLAGRTFFEKVVLYQSRHNQHNRKIVNAIQTNGTLLNDSWARWFAKHHFRVGVSIDGTPYLHNKYRRDASGKGTWEKALQAFRVLRKYGVDGGALVVVHREAAKYGKEIVRTLHAQGIKAFGFNPYHAPLYQDADALPDNLFVSPALYAQFWDDVLDAWLDLGDPELIVREIDEVMKIELGVEPSLCYLNGTCHHHLAIYPNGDVYPCNKISPSDEVHFGNILEDSLNAILSSEKYQKFVAKIRTRPAKCGTCPLGSFCYNGCTRHRQDGEFVYCRAYRLILDRIRSLIGG